MSMKKVKIACAQCGAFTKLWLRFGLKKLPEGTRILCAPCRKLRDAATQGMEFPHDQDGWLRRVSVEHKGRPRTDYEQVISQVKAQALDVIRQKEEGHAESFHV